MKIEIIAVGKLKEQYLREAVKEYSKRLSRNCNLVVYEVKEEVVSSHPSVAEREHALRGEGERIKKHIKDGAFVVALDIKGEEASSEALAHNLEELMLQGKSHFTFLIGGSFGLHSSVLDRANWRLSFSKMTFPHQLMRVILCEQLYRSFTIQKGEPYHK